MDYEETNKAGFREFVDKEADLTAGFANLDELVEFAFGELESAVAEFERARGKKYETLEEYLDDEYFQGFVSDEFDNVQIYASDDEIAEWAFGSREEAEDKYKEGKSGS